MTSSLRVPTLLVAIVVLLSTLVAAPALAATRARTGPEQLAEDVLLGLHGQARSNPGAFGYAATPKAGAITGWTDIREVSRAWADQQAAAAKMSHNPRFSDQLCCWQLVGENVAYTTLRSLDDAAVDAAARRIFQAWMDSTGHRNNILNPAYDQMGLGVSIASASGAYVMWLTANFRDTTGTPPGTAYGVSSSGTTAQAAPEPTPYDTPACPDGAYDRGLYQDSLTGTHAGAIDCMTWWGIVRTSDAPGDVYGQGDLATRAFMAAIVARTAAAGGRPLPATTIDAFRDDEGDPYEDAINRVVAAGLAGGFPDGSFRPDASLTRAQMATFLAVLYTDWLGFPAVDAGDQFDDDDGSIHEANIDLVAAAGIALGTGTRRFSPSSHLTRGQLASFAARTADHLAMTGVSPA